MELLIAHRNYSLTKLILDLRALTVSDVTSAALDMLLQRYPNLEWLGLKNHISVSDDVFDSLASLQRLNWLNLCGTACTADGFVDFLSQRAAARTAGLTYAYLKFVCSVDCISYLLEINNKAYKWPDAKAVLRCY
jgi:hypothetical protein